MTRWIAVLTLFAGGCTLALHSGKAPPALLALRSDFGLSLTAAGALVSVYAALIALGGVLLGSLVARFGYARFAVGGIALAGAGSLLGASTDRFEVLMASRAIEGAGWIVAVIALPALIGTLSSERDRPLALALWGAFVPVGAGSMLLVAPYLQAAGGWSLSWAVAGSVSLLAAAAVLWTCRRHAGRLAPLSGATGTPVWRDLRSAASIGIAASFFLYSFQFLAVTSFLPTLLVEVDGLSLERASSIAAVVILANASGNLAAGRLLQRGLPTGRVLGVAALLSSCAAAIAYQPAVPWPLRSVAALLFSMIGGVIPGTLFASVSRAASVPASAALIIGLMLQGSGAGQLLGPLGLSWLVEASGRWSSVGWLTLGSGLGGAVLALWLGARLEVRSER